MRGGGGNWGWDGWMDTQNEQGVSVGDKDRLIHRRGRLVRSISLCWGVAASLYIGSMWEREMHWGCADALKYLGRSRDWWGIMGWEVWC